MDYRGTGEYFLVFNALVNAARIRGTVTYQELADVMGLPITGNYMGKELGLCLGEISRDQGRFNKPMLSAVAVDVKGMPGDGFFELATELGKYKMGEDRREFWKSEVERVYDLWKRKFSS